MKMAISFIMGIVVCGLLLFGVKSVLPIRADSDNLTEQSENLTQSFINFLPDIERIYRESLLLPFEKAESKIYDEDIAEFYRELLDNTGLRSSGNGTN